VKTRPCVLTIAGSDSGAGAGIQSDSRVIHALGGYALTAISAVTAQNSRGVDAWHAVSSALLAAQINAVLDDFPVGAIKTGLLPGEAIVRAVVDALERHRGIPLVVDPVIGSTSGTRFLSTRALKIVRQTLLPRATLVTPNWPEADALTGVRVQTFADVEAAASALLETGCGAVLVKGGHAPGAICRDCLVTKDGRVRWFESKRVKTQNTHGTGCVLSAAIAVGLARGRSIETAVTDARKFLQQSLISGRKIKLGAGHGPAFLG